jgi:hypothetical protein
MLAYADESSLAEGLARLAADLHSGQWQQRHAELLEQQRLDAGYRLLVSDCN